MSSEEQGIAAVASEWRQIEAALSPIRDWEIARRQMEAEERALRARGHWRSGGRTLLRALSVHHDEVLLCRGLAWLLTPDGWHGIGPALLDRLATRLGKDTRGSENATVTIEELRDGTRADIVVRYGGTCLLMEAKVWAVEQPAQADRLADNWSNEAPTLVFLTQDGRHPASAQRSAGEWIPLSWSDVAELLRQAVRDRPDCTSGVREYLETLQLYGGAA